MEIGDPQREIVIEPIEDPVPRERPKAPPDPAVPEREKEPELVPA